MRQFVLSLDRNHHTNSPTTISQPFKTNVRPTYLTSIESFQLYILHYYHITFHNPLFHMLHTRSWACSFMTFGNNLAFINGVFFFFERYRDKLAEIFWPCTSSRCSNGYYVHDYYQTHQMVSALVIVFAIVLWAVYTVNWNIIILFCVYFLITCISSIGIRLGKPYVVLHVNFENHCPVFRVQFRLCSIHNSLFISLSFLNLVECVSSPPIDICHFEAFITFHFSLVSYTEPIVRKSECAIVF